jgi:hypothetical protein
MDNEDNLYDILIDVYNHMENDKKAEYQSKADELGITVLDLMMMVLNDAINTPGYFEENIKEIQQIDHDREVATKLLNDLDVDIDL